MKRELLAPCGLYCGVCGILQAHRNGDEPLKGKLAAVYGLKPEDIRCEGCLSDVVFVYCRVCPIKKCTGEKGYEGCFACADFPCRVIEEFPFPEGKRVMLRAVPAWRDLGTERWEEEERKRYSCSQCGALLFRGARKCRACGSLYTES